MMRGKIKIHEVIEELYGVASEGAELKSALVRVRT